MSKFTVFVDIPELGYSYFDTVTSTNEALADFSKFYPDMKGRLVFFSEEHRPMEFEVDPTSPDPYKEIRVFVRTENRACLAFTFHEV